MSILTSPSEIEIPTVEMFSGLWWKRTGIDGGGGEGQGKTVVEFVDIDFPQIEDYLNDYAPIYGQYPTIVLYTIDENLNRVERSERPYFVMNVDGKIESVNFGTLSDGNQTGFITISK